MKRVFGIDWHDIRVWFRKKEPVTISFVAGQYQLLVSAYVADEAFPKNNKYNPSERLNTPTNETHNGKEFEKTKNLEICEIIPTTMSMPIGTGTFRFTAWFLWFSVTMGGRNDLAPFLQKEAGGMTPGEIERGSFEVNPIEPLL